MYTGKISIENKIIDSEHYFKIVYCPEIKEYMLCVYIAWVAGYDRYYKIGEGDLSLYETNRSEFYAKYEKEIHAKMLVIKNFIQSFGSFIYFFYS